MGVAPCGNRIPTDSSEASAVRDGKGFDPEVASQTTSTCEIRDCAMANVCLPFVLSGGDVYDHPTPSSSISPICAPLASALEVASYLTSTLIRDHKIGVAIFPYKRNIWLRVSGQIYLELQDFDRFASVLVQVLEEVRTRTWR